jgi:hypothetical protein
MLIEIWERLRGYDKWTETEAKIKSSKTEIVVRRKRKGRLIYGWDGNKGIAWTDQRGVHRVEHLEVNDGPLVFKRYDGEPVVIRYNPASPSEFYVREQLRYQVILEAKIALAILVALGVIVILVIVRN